MHSEIVRDKSWLNNAEADDSHLIEDLVIEVIVFPPSEWVFAGQEYVEEDAQRPDVDGSARRKKLSFRRREREREYLPL